MLYFTDQMPTISSVIIFLLPLTLCAPPLQRNLDKDKENPLVKVHRPNHLDGVPLERDGDLNKDFKQEVLLGEDIPEDPTELKNAVREMFNRSDIDRDGFLSEQEILTEIRKNTEKHVSDSQQEAIKLMPTIDKDGNGKISWAEYRNRFILDEDIKVDSREEPMDKEDHLRLGDEKHAFHTSDLDHSDDLDENEWIGFLHPELSVRSLQEMAEDILQSYDANKDGMMSKEEFAASQPMMIEGPFAENDDTEQRRQEFMRDIDENGDGLATLKELVNYVNPRNEARHKKEVSDLIYLCDEDRDGRLSLKEVLSKDFLLEKSALISAKRRLHEDL